MNQRTYERLLAQMNPLGISDVPEILCKSEPEPLPACWYCGETIEDHHVRYGANLAKPMHRACYEDRGN